MAKPCIVIALLLALLVTACRNDGNGSTMPNNDATVPTVTLPLDGVSLPDPSMRAEIRLEEARRARRIGEWERAIVYYESLRTEPDFAADALLELGDLYLQDGQPLAAAASWQAGLPFAEADSEQAANYSYRLGRGFAAIGQHAQAIALWQSVDELTDDGDGWLAQRIAQSYEALDQAEEAAAQWQRVYENDGMVRVSRALAAQHVGDLAAESERWAEALLWYERTLALSEIDSFRAELIERMADFAVELGDEGYAENQWHLLIDEYPAERQALSAVRALEARGTATPLRRLATLYGANAQWQAAERTFDLLLESAPNDADLLRSKAQLLEQAGRWEAAEVAWQTLFDQEDKLSTGGQAEALAGVARCQAAQGKVTQALSTIEQLLEAFPESEAAPQALWERAERIAQEETTLLTKAEAYERLIATYPAAPQSVEARWQAGLLRYRAGQLAAARALWEPLLTEDEAMRLAAELWIGKAAFGENDGATANERWAGAAAIMPASFYALRARALLNGERWQPRQERQPVDNGSDVDLESLAETLGVELSALQVATISSPRFAQGERLLAWGERQPAIGHFYEATSSTDDLATLWVMATRLSELDVSSASQAAANRLLRLAELDAMDAPLPLVALAYPIPFDRELWAAVAPYSIDPLLLASLAHRESAWEPAAYSVADARGLTQVIPDTGAWIAGRLLDQSYEFKRLDRPVVALEYGAYYLDYVLRQFDDNPWHALAAYNAGPGNARRWIVEDDDLYVELVPFAETKLYLESIYERWWAYDRIYQERQ